LKLEVDSAFRFIYQL